VIIPAIGIGIILVIITMIRVVHVSPDDSGHRAAPSER
jgi:hypothetical protein